MIWGGEVCNSRPFSKEGIKAMVPFCGPAFLKVSKGALDTLPRKSFLTLLYQQMTGIRERQNFSEGGGPRSPGDPQKIGTKNCTIAGIFSRRHVHHNSKMH